MRRNGVIARTGALMILLSLLALGAGVQAQSGGDFSLVRWTVDGGGGESQGGDMSLRGTAGQPDAGLLQGGEFTLGGGFLPGGELGGEPTIYQIYLPVALRGVP